MPSAAPHSIWSPFQYLIFRMLWISALISNIGSWMHEVSAAWLMTTLTHQPILVAMVQAITAFAVCLLAIPSGALADILDKRRHLIHLQIWMMIIASILCVVTFLGKTTPSFLLLMTFLLSVGTALNAPTWQSVVPELVPAKELVNAITLNSMGVNFARTIGPALAGIIIASFGPAYVFALNAISYLGIIMVLFHWKREIVISTLPGERFIGAMKAGIRYVKGSPILKIVMLKAVALFFFISCYWALLPLVSRTLLQKGSVAYGILLAMLGLGAVCAALFAQKIRDSFKPDMLILTSGIAFAVAMLILIIFPSMFIACISSFITGVAWLSALSLLNSTVQQKVPSWVRARAMSVYLMALFGSLSLGGILWGWLATHYGISITIMIAGIGIFCINLLVYKFITLESYGKIDYDHTPSMNLPAPSIDSAYHDEGPVMVTVEYRVSKKNVPHFTQAIHELRLTRIREGAFSWTLFHDVEEPAKFVECFLVESWLEHLRFHERVSVSDRKIQAHVNSFCEELKPITTHFIAYSYRKKSKRWTQ